MKLLRYLTWFGDAALKSQSALYSLAYGFQRAMDDFSHAIDSMTDQLYLLTATGRWLDLWGEELARLKRKHGESDDLYRARIVLTLFRVKVIRKAVILAVEIVTGRKPVEVFEPIRDSAYWNAGFFFTPRQNDASAADDGSGVYTARMGTVDDTSYMGYVRVRLAGDYVGGAGLSYFRLCFGGRGFFLSSVSDRKRAITRAEVLDAVQLVQPAGSFVMVEFMQ